MGFKKILLGAIFGLSLGCGSSSTGSSTYTDMNSYHDMNTNDSETDKRDEGFLGKDSENNLPEIEFDPEMSRNIRVGRPKTLTAIVNEGIECRWDFGDGTESDYGNCSVEHTYDSEGEKTITATARNSEKLENSVSDVFTAYNNIPPHADAGPDIEGLEIWTNYCFVFGPCPQADEDGCEFAPYAPGHSAKGTNNYDEDGDIDEDGYEIHYRYNIAPLLAVLDACTGAVTYSSAGTYTLRLILRDNDGLESYDEATIAVGL